jgi:ABC-type sugar transport system substrate-binding protein
MREMKKLLFLLCALLLVLGSGSVLAESASETTAALAESAQEIGTLAGQPVSVTAALKENGERKQVYLLYPTLQWPFPVSLMEACAYYAEKSDIDLTIFDSNLNDNLQYEQAMQAIEDEVDLVILCSLSDRGIVIMRQLNEAGIPCVILNQEPAEGSEEYYTSAIVTNDYDDSKKIVELLLERFDGKDFNVVVIGGEPADSGNTGRLKGFYETIEGHNNVNVLGEQAANWDKARAISVMENFITKHGKDIDVAFCCDDTMAAGAVEALTAAGMGGGKVLVTGNSLSREAIAYIKSGEMFCSASHEPWDMALLCMETASRVLNGEVVEKRNYCPNPIYTIDNISEYPYGEGTW